MDKVPETMARAIISSDVPVLPHSAVKENLQTRYLHYKQFRYFYGHFIQKVSANSHTTVNLFPQ